MRACTFVIAIATAATAMGQGEAQPRVPLGLDVSLPAAKRMAGAREFVAAGDWDAAIKSLDQLSQEFGDSLIAVEPNRYVNVREAVAATLALFPKPGLAVYRRRVDPAMELLFEEALARQDPVLMRQVVREGFASSHGDDALDWLAEDALEHGDLDAARAWWTAMLPFPPDAGQLGPVALRSPDAERTPAEVRARLVLCSILEGDRTRAARDLAAVSALHPEASGALGGRTGMLAEILGQLLAESSQWVQAGNAESQAALMSPLWSRMLPGSISKVGHESNELSLITPAPVLSPEVWKDTVVVANPSRVRALSLSTGESRWPAGPDDDGALASTDASAEQTASSSKGGAESCGHVAGAHYYARLESTGLSELVCLDLEAEGRTAWRVASDQLRELPRSRFSGSPLVDDGKLFITLRRSEPQMEVGLACLDAATGQLNWDRRLCTDLAAAPETGSGTGDDVLAAGGGLVFQIPSAGVITACDGESGHLKWAVIYALKPAHTRDANVDRGGALLYRGGRLFVTANDMGEVLALDASSGRRLWTVTGASPIRDLLGVSEGRVIAAGDQLWGFDAETGGAWRFGFDDPEGYGYGRGALAGRRVYWPTREELFVIDASSGSLLDRLNLESAGLTGGNVAIAGDRLLIAAPDRLTALGRRRVD